MTPTPPEETVGPHLHETDIKLVIFDLDGVLVDSRELHYEALNRALAEFDPKYVIGREEHLAQYDGLPTTAKLNMLSKEKGLPTALHDKVWKLKQDKTFEVINDTFQYDNRLRSVLAELKRQGLQLFCASNSIYNTIKLMLLRKGVLEFFDFIMSCEDVAHPKPAPDIYISCCMRANVPVRNTVILEDSHVGRHAALMSGCHLLPVENPGDVTLERIMTTVKNINLRQAKKLPLELGKGRATTTVIIPMAGSYEDYMKAGFEYPGPLVEVNGKPMVQTVVENLNLRAHYVFIVRAEVAQKFNVKYLLEAISPGCTVVLVDKPTTGQAATVLLAKEHVSPNSPVVVANCNQYIDWDSDAFEELCHADDVDGSIVTFKNNHPRFSYVRYNHDTLDISDIAEKSTISDNATAGVYYFKKAASLFKLLEDAVESEESVGGSFYISSAFGRAIKAGHKIRAFPCKAMYPLNFPNDLANFYVACKENAISN